MNDSIPVFITCRDRLDPLIKLISWLEQAHCDEIYLVDNGSSYPPLLRYFDTCRHTVVRLNNLGSRSPWTAGVVNKYAGNRRYVVTDFDVVPSPDCPFDAISYLSRVLDRYPQYLKVGLGLRVDDLPFSTQSDVIRMWESQFARRRITRELYHAQVDTTFALYRNNTEFALAPALRTGPPYLAQHLPWYEDYDNPTDEMIFYITHAIPGMTTWLAEDAFAKYREHAEWRNDKLYWKLRWQAYRYLVLRNPLAMSVIRKKANYL